MTDDDLPRTPKQYEFQLKIEKEVEVDGVGMGVLNDGTPYLTLRGMARMCGVDESSVRGIVGAWNDSPAPRRVAKIRSALDEAGFDWNLPYVAIVKDGSTHYACPDSVCMAFLEYYAFDAKPASPQAVKSYRRLGRKTLRDLIYSGVGYDPDAGKQVIWQNFHDRIDLSYDNVPDGYFSIFKETASMQLAMIREGVAIGCKFIPDSSIGGLWGRRWRDDGLAKLYGERIPYDHYYPSSYPQAKSNPQPAHCYPDLALKPFKKWLRETYIENGLPNYLKTKTRDGSMTAPLATATLAAIRKAALPRTAKGIGSR